MGLLYLLLGEDDVASYWLSFLIHLCIQATEFLVEPVILSVAFRVTRNCFWDPSIWNHAIRLMV
jgi:hypothetical protein